MPGAWSARIEITNSDAISPRYKKFKEPRKAEFTATEWEILEGISIQKIGEAEAVLVIDSFRNTTKPYVGEHTQKELVFADCSVYYLSSLRIPEVDGQNEE